MKGVSYRILHALLLWDFGENFNKTARRWLADESIGEQQEKELAESIGSLYTERLTADLKTLEELNAFKRRQGIPLTEYRILDGRVVIPDFKSQKNNPSESPTVPLVKLRRRPVWMKVAAVLAPLLIVGASSWFIIQKSSHTGLPLTTDRYTSVSSSGDPRDIVLPDGSRITVKSGIIEYAEDFSTNRKVKVSGEAFFTVTRDEAHPFTVHAEGMTVTVLGTEFNVRAIEDEATTEVTLAKGKVRVDAEGIAETTLMEPGQTYIYHKNHRTIELDEIGETELMRLRGMSLDFDNPLDEIFETIQKYYGKRLVLRDSIDLDRHVVVPFAGDETIEQVMDGLRIMTGAIFDYTIDHDTITLTNPEHPN